MLNFNYHSLKLLQPLGEVKYKFNDDLSAFIFPVIFRNKHSLVYRSTSTTVDKIRWLESIHNYRRQLRGHLRYLGDNMITIDNEKMKLQSNLGLLFTVSDYNQLCTARDCRNVLPIDRTFTSQGPLFAVDSESLYGIIRTSYAEGDDLSTILREKLSLKDIAVVTLQMADTLDDLAAKDIVHRDIKPGNIMYDFKTKKATLIDFGLAYSPAEQESPFLSPDLQNLLNEREDIEMGRILGTPAYLSPEHVRGNTSPQSDLFSFGLTLYDFIVGHNLSFKFDHQDTYALFWYLINYETPEKKKLMDEVNRAVDSSSFRRHFLPCLESILDPEPQKRERDSLRTCAERFLHGKERSWTEIMGSWLNKFFSFN
ncbi:MAG: protein kinase [Nanoarchaeota archaeon]|nr:protein kinase [Nanoarchaeota archaeon]